jgi:hypothetical protein
VMDIRRSELEVAYKFSTWTAKARPLLLTKATHLAALFDAARTELNQLAKAKGKKKAFQIILVDQRETSRKGGKRRADDKKDKVIFQLIILCTGLTTCLDKVKAKRKKRVDTDEESGNDTESGKKMSKTSADYIAEITENLKCPLHDGKPCVKYPEGHHYTLQITDLSLWGMLLVSLSFIYCLTRLIVVHVRQTAHMIRPSRHLSS